MSLPVSERRGCGCWVDPATNDSRKPGTIPHEVTDDPRPQHAGFRDDRNQLNTRTAANVTRICFPASLQAMMGVLSLWHNITDSPGPWTLSRSPQLLPPWISVKEPPAWHPFPVSSAACTTFPSPPGSLSPLLIDSSETPSSRTSWTTFMMWGWRSLLISWTM